MVTESAICLSLFLISVNIFSVIDLPLLPSVLDISVFEFGDLWAVCWLTVAVNWDENGPEAVTSVSSKISSN